MPDKHTKAQRSYNMSRIRASNTKPELALRKALWASGLRYRTSNNQFLGKPDLTFRKEKLAIFVDGCFWHKCPQHFIRPKNNKAYWNKKILSNVKRDQRINQELVAQGWRILRFWEHELEMDLADVIKRVSLELKKKPGDLAMD